METVRVGLRRETKQLGAKEKARRKNCDVRFSFAQKKSCLSELSEGWCEEVAGDGLGPFESGQRTCSGQCAYRKVG